MTKLSKKDQALLWVVGTEFETDGGFKATVIGTTEKQGVAQPIAMLLEGDEEPHIESYSKDGSYIIGGDFHPNTLVSLWSELELEFEEEEAVFVREKEEDEWSPRYFASYKNGKYHCFEWGQTKWSSRGKTCSWNYIKKVKA